MHEDTVSQVPTCGAGTSRAHDRTSELATVAAASAPTPSRPASAPLTSVSATAAANADLCMDAFRIVLNDHNNDGKQWFVSTVNLSMISLEFCVACRSSRNYHLCVPWGTPQWMWAPALSQRASRVLERSFRSSRSSSGFNADAIPRQIPALPVRGMTWGLSTTTTFFLEDNKLFRGLESLVFGDHFNDDISEVVWPKGLKRLAFGRGFNQGIGRVVYPASLRELSFGTWFNRSLDGVRWPASLRKLSFGDLFNKPIEAIPFPGALQQLSLGFCFDRPIARVKWPASLEELSFGHNFSQPIDRVAWPESLRVLRFGHGFDQEIESVRWPPALKEVVFGWRFDRPIDRVAWPASLEILSFGYSFNQDLDKVRWPALLRKLSLADSFDRPLQGVAWPTGLEEIRLGFRLDCSLVGVRWPAGLRRLAVRQGVVTDQSCVVLPPGATTHTFREQRSRACGAARRYSVGLALVSVAQLLATAGSQHVPRAQAAVDRGSGGAADQLNLAREEVGGRRRLLREGGLRLLQEETPAPAPVESAAPAETPAPSDSEEESDTPAPTGEEETPETPVPATDGTPAPEGGEPETPAPVVAEETAAPAPVEDGVTPETPAPVSEETPTSPAPVDAATTPTPVVPEPEGSPAPFAPSQCPNGIPGVASGSVCCREECGLCGGVGCGAVPGTNGASDCCPDTIIEEAGGAVCGEAPCVMEGFTPSPVNPATVGTAAPVEPSTCAGGIPGYQDGSVCCLESCGRCGGDGCGTIPGTGGSANCCPSDILASGVVCGEAPCIIEGYTPAPAVVGGGTAAPIGTSTCSNGMLGYQDGPVCCAANCGQCGDVGCGAIPGTAGASACCSSTIAVEGQLCSVTGESPCIIDNYTPAPVVPDIGSAAPVVPSTCSNGLPGYQNLDICCLESCGVCGGVGCGTIPGTGGSASCCPTTIREGGQICGNGVVAPCIIGDYTPAPVNPALVGTASPVVPTTCSNGLPGFQNGAACCKESCGQCGGVGCGTIPGTGGSESCCATDVLEANNICGNGVVAPCVIENYTPAPMGVPGELQPFAASTCSNGLAGVQDENVCCAENCGQCGGVGCGTIPGTGGSEACCSNTIAVNGTDCLDAQASPCIISDWVPTPSPTVFVSAAPVVFPLLSL
eukprot:g8086.t2